MALQATFKEDHGFTVATEVSYIKVHHISGDKECIDAVVKFFHVIHVVDDERILCRTSSFSFVPSLAEGEPNFIAQTYAFMKTLPEFADAIDC